MEKSVFTLDYLIFLRCLRAARERAGLTQAGLAERLGETQSFVSKCERGERRLDIVDLKEFCRAMGIPLVNFVEEFEREVERGKK